MTNYKQLNPEEYAEHLSKQGLREDEIRLVLSNVFRKDRPIPDLKTKKKRR